MISGVNSEVRPGIAGSDLVGRAREVTVVTTALDQATSGTGRLCIIAGEPGIGKTRLADELARLARERDALVVWGRCWEGGGAPAYWPWIQVVRSLIDELGIDGLLAALGESTSYIARIVPELAKLSEETAPVLTTDAEDRFVLFDAMARLLRNVSKQRLLVIVLDDLHAADEASLHLLHFVARGLRDMHALIVGTSVEQTSGSSVATKDLISAIGREGDVVRLEGLERDSIARLYEQMTGAVPSEPALAAIDEATGGNPYFVGEAVRLEASEGELRRPDLSLGLRVPKGAKEVMQRKLAPLSADALTVLSAAAVIGRAFDAPTVKEVSGLNDAALVELLGEALAAGVLKELGMGRYGFTHVLLRETLYEDLGAADRMRLHSMIAEALEERYRDDRDEHVDELAHHLFKAGQAGDDDKALRYLTRAAEKAAAAMAHEEAARLYHRALKVAEWAGVPSSRRRRIAEMIKAAEKRAKQAMRSETERSIDEGRRFSCEGDYWSITYDGRVCRVRDAKGLRYLMQLLKNPHKEVHCLDLVLTIEGSPAPVTASREDGLVVDAGNAEAILDPRAKAQYKRRLKDLSDELEEARAYNDPERAAKAQTEIDALVEQLAAGVGLGGRDRRAASQAERARVNVTKALKAAIGNIEQHHPSLGHHLETTVRTGTFCSYKPDPSTPNPWRF